MMILKIGKSRLVIIEDQLPSIFRLAKDTLHHKDQLDRVSQGFESLVQSLELRKGRTSGCKSI